MQMAQCSWQTLKKIDGSTRQANTVEQKEKTDHPL